MPHPTVRDGGVQEDNRLAAAGPLGRDLGGPTGTIPDVVCILSKIGYGTLG
ncbi:hypothetical protein [Microvirga ossetica]|uniref:hypothetical protein n=1 Tax=Microvirga ossetica TaxID=1882682 RepID=UPI001F3D5D7A|nr:hypothetical protein [Microvirga ossetica]